VSELELTNVVATGVPFKLTVEEELKPVPVKVNFAALFMGPLFGEIPVSVGTGGFVMDTVAAFDNGFTALGLETVMLAVPVAVRRVEGTVANRSDALP